MSLNSWRIYFSIKKLFNMGLFCSALFPHLNLLPHFICISFSIFFPFSFTMFFHFHTFAGEKLALQTMLFSTSGDFTLACFPALSLPFLHPLSPFSTQQVEASLPLHQHPPSSSLLAAYIPFNLSHPSSSASLALVPGVSVSARHTGSR